MNSLRDRLILRAIAKIGAGFCLLMAGIVMGATITWTGDDGSGTVWNQSLNWSSTVPGSTDIAVLGAAGSATQIGIDLTSGTNNGAGQQIVGRISLDAASTLSRTIGNSSATAGTLRIAGVSAVLLENLNAGLTLTLAPTVLGGSQPMALLLSSGTIDAVGDIHISSDISGTAFTKTGGGVLTLTGTNTYTGNTTISAGTLQIGDGGTSGTPGFSNISIASGADLTFNRSDSVSTGFIISGAGTLTQAGGGTTILTGGNSYTGTTFLQAGTLQIGNGATAGTLGSGAVVTSSGATLAVNRSNDLTMFNVISGPGSLKKQGAGNLSLRGANSFTGVTTIEQGVLTVNPVAATHTLGGGGDVVVEAAGTLAFSAGSDFSFANVISGSGAVLRSGSSAVVTLTGSNSYTGSTRLVTGVLGVQTLANGGTDSSIGAAAADAGNLVFDGGTLRYTGGGSTTDRLFSVGTGSAIIEANGSGALQFTNSGALGFNGQSGTRLLALRGSNTDANSLAAVIGDNGGATSVRKDGSGTWVLSGASTYSGSTRVLGGTLIVSSLADAGAASSIGAAGVSETNLVLSAGATLRYTGSGDSIDRLFSVGTTGGTIDSSGTGALVFTGTGSMGFDGLNVARTLTLRGSNTGDNTISAVIGSQGGATSLTKADAGKWVLNGDNTYSGLTTISAGTLQVGAGGVSGSLGSGNVTNNGALVVDRSDSISFGQTISGGGTFTQAGSGTTILSGVNTLTGVTTISAGTLQLGAGGTTGSIASTSIVNDGTLTINRSNAVTLTASISGSGGLTQQGSGTTTLAGALSYTGATVVSAGRLQSTVSVSIPNSDFTIASGASVGTNATSGWSIGALDGAGTVENGGSSASTLTVGGSGNSGTFTGLIQNGGVSSLSVVKTGGGTQSFGSANTYTGRTTISGGVLSVDLLANGGVASGIGASSDLASNLVLDGGSLNYTGSGVSTDRRFDLGVSGGGLHASGSGAVVWANTAAIGFHSQSGARALTLAGSSTAANTLSAVITDSDAPTALIKDGAGTWLLTSTNTYTGGTSLNGGVLRISSSNAVGTGAITFAGGVLEVTQSMSLDNSLIVNDANNGVAVNAGTLTINGPISGLHPLYKDGLGTLIIASASNSVPTVVQNGTVQGAAANAGTRIDLSNATATFAFNQIDPGTYGGIIGGAGNITVAGAGGLVLTGSNTYTGVTTITDGVLTLQNDDALGSTAGGILVLNGGTLELKDDIVVGAEALQINGAGAAGQSGALVSSSGANTYGGQITVTTNSSFAALPGSTLTLSGGIVKNGTVATFTGGGTILIHGAGISGADPNSDLVVDGSGTNVVLNTVSSYNGPTTIQNSAQLTLGISGALPTTPRTDMTIDSSGVFDLAGHSDTAASLTGSSSGTVRNSTVATISTLGIAPASGSTTFSGVIEGTAGGTQGDIALTKSGGGTQILDGTNTYSGGTTITGGTLQIGSGGSSGTLGAGDVVNDGTLSINRSGAVTLNQLITGSGSLTQSGSGTTTLTGSNSYSGGTTITGGALRLGDGGTTGSAGSGAVVNDGQLQVNRSNSITLGQAITGSGSLSQVGSGVTTLSGNANTYSGGTTVESGTLVAANTLASSSATGAGSVLVQSGATLAGSGRISGDVHFSAGSTLLVGNLISDTHGQDFEFVGGLSSSGSFEAVFDLFSNAGTGTLNSTIAADQILVSGTDRLISLSLDLVLADPNSLLNWAAEDSWQIWNWGGISPGNRSLTVNSLTAPALPSHLHWDTSQLNTTGTISLSSVPEPGRPFLLLSGFVAWLRRRRRHDA